VLRGGKGPIRRRGSKPSSGGQARSIGLRGLSGIGNLARRGALLRRQVIHSKLDANAVAKVLREVAVDRDARRIRPERLSM